MIQILLADDDEDQVVITRRALRSVGRSVQVEVVQDGSEVLECLARGPTPDLVLLDLHMPRMTGIAVLEVLRADVRYFNLPVVVVSATMAAEDEARVQAALATAFLAKSGNLKEFSESLRTLIDTLVPPTAC